jgi:hypothetical protein
MKISNGIVMADDFLLAFEELLSKEMPAKQCLEINQSLDELMGHYQILKRTQISIVSKYAVVKEDGSILFDEKGKVVFKSQEDEQKCSAEIMEIREESIDIPLSNKVKIYDDFLTTPKKLFLLQDVVDVVERAKPQEAPAQQN